MNEFKFTLANLQFDDTKTGKNGLIFFSPGWMRKFGLSIGSSVFVSISDTTELSFMCGFNIDLFPDNNDRSIYLSEQYEEIFFREDLKIPGRDFLLNRSPRYKLSLIDYNILISKKCSIHEVKRYKELSNYINTNSICNCINGQFLIFDKKSKSKKAVFLKKIPNIKCIQVDSDFIEDQIIENLRGSYKELEKNILKYNTVYKRYEDGFYNAELRYRKIKEDFKIYSELVKKLEKAGLLNFIFDQLDLSGLTKRLEKKIEFIKQNEKNNQMEDIVEYLKKNIPVSVDSTAVMEIVFDTLWTSKLEISLENVNLLDKIMEEELGQHLLKKTLNYSKQKTVEDEIDNNLKLIDDMNKEIEIVQGKNSILEKFSNQTSGVEFEFSDNDLESESNRNFQILGDQLNSIVRVCSLLDINREKKIFEYFRKNLLVNLTADDFYIVKESISHIKASFDLCLNYISNTNKHRKVNL